jgi:NADH-quinone oxidoreductase subunit M
MMALLVLISPLIFLVAVLLFPANKSRQIALAGGFTELILVVIISVQFHRQLFANLSFDIPWVESLGIHFNIGVDGISLILVLLTGILYPFIVAATSNNQLKSPRAFYSLMLLMQFALMGVFMARDAFLFYLFYEMTLMPVYFICAIWGGERSIPVTLKFFIYTLAGSLVMLIAILYLYFKVPGDHSFSIESFYALSLNPSEQSWIFWAFFLAFAVKIPVFPFHTWQPDTYTVSPVAGTMLLAGLMLKMGIYGLIRFVIPIVPQGVEQWSTLTLILCVIGIVYSSLIALRQQDLKRLIAYSSIAHVGLMTAGVFSVNSVGLQGAMIQMFNHGVNTVAVFFMIDLIEKRYNTRMINELGGIAGQMKRFSVFFFLILLGNVGLPLTNGFIGEFLLLMGIYQKNGWTAAFAGLTLILGAAYMFRMYRNVFLGQAANQQFDSGDSKTRENWIIIPLCTMIILLGIYPSLLLNISEKSVEQILVLFNQNNISTGSL